MATPAIRPSDLPLRRFRKKPRLRSEIISSSRTNDDRYGVCHVRRAPGQVVLKGLRLTAEVQQAARNMALESKAEILSQVLPTSKELNL